MSQIQEQLEGLPGYDIVMDLFNEYAEEHFNNMDPYEDSDGSRLKLSKQYNTSKEHKLWKRVQARAWLHDKCFLGSCGVGMDCGLGLAPVILLLLPGLGPLMMYVVHSRLITIVQQEIPLPNKLVLKLQSQILFDLLITFPPLIGSFFGWLHSCSTRNAALIYQYLEFIGKQRQLNKVPTYIGTERNPHPEPTYQPVSKKKKAKKREDIVVQDQQETGFV